MERINKEFKSLENQGFIKILYNYKNRNEMGSVHGL
jgi:hypothetical protein